MKIVRIIARLNMGGPARHVVWLTDALRCAGHESVLVAGVVPSGEEDMTYFAAEHGVCAQVIPEMSREISVKDLITVWKLYKLFVREQPDIVHTHTAKAGTVGRVAGLLYRWLTPGALLGKPRRCRFVHTYHGHIFHSYYGALKTRVFLTIERLLAQLVTDRIVVISPQQRREIHEEFGVGTSAQIALIPLGIDTEIYRNWLLHHNTLRLGIGAARQDVLIGIVGRLTEVKNHKLFLEAAARLKEIRGTSSGVRFVIIGDGHLRQELANHAKALNLEKELIFLGVRHDPQDFYPGLDVVALTSLNEGTPLTLIEAMANGRAVIATAVGGVVDLLGQQETAGQAFSICERGLLVKTMDVEGFSAGLRRLIEDAALRNELGLRGAKFVEDHYTKERLTADVLSLYEELIQPGVLTSKVVDRDREMRITSKEIEGR